MNLRESNNAFREQYSKVLTEGNQSVSDRLRELLLSAVRDCIRKGCSIKGIEVALQDVIEREFPDNLWWEVTNCSIFSELLSGKSPVEVVDSIVANIQPQFLTEEESVSGPDVGDDAELTVEALSVEGGDDLTDAETETALKEWGEFSDDEVEDDYMHSMTYGGDSRYCRYCGSVKQYDEDGFSFCPDCDRSENIEEDVFADWKPDTSFKHIKDIYNKLKSNGYVYANNEREEFMAAVRKADEGGYKPEERRQIKQWHRDVWQNRRDQMHQSYMKEDYQSAGKTISRATLARLRNKR